MNRKHSVAAVNDLRHIASGTGGNVSVLCGSDSREYYAGVHRGPAGTLLEAAMTLLGTDEYTEIVLFAGYGEHLPPLTLGPSVRLGATRAVVFLRRANDIVDDGSREEPHNTGSRFKLDVGRRRKTQRAANLNRIEVDAQNMDWKSRVGTLLDKIETWCGLDHLGNRSAANGAKSVTRRLILIDTEFLIPNPAMWQHEIAAAHSEAGHLPARFRRIPENIRNTYNDVVLLARDPKEAHSVEGGTLVYRRLDKSAETHEQLRLSWPDARCVTIPGSSLGSAFREFYPASTGSPYDHFRHTVPINPQIARVVPLEKMNAEEIFQRMRREVIGQDEALRKIAETVFTSVVNRSLDDRRPIAKFILAGPTGTGKTETAKALAKALFGRTDQGFEKIEMERCKANPQSLFGWDSAYQGLTEDKRLNGGGLLTRPFIADPNQTWVILLDEFEKSHPETPDVLFSALDEGTARDTTSGHRVSFRNAIFVVTTNSAEAQLSRLADGNTSWNALAKQTPELLSSVEHSTGFRWSLPFLARFDCVLPLSYPGPADLPLIALKLARGILGAKHRVAAVSPAFLDWAVGSYDKRRGIRELYTVVNDRLKGQLAELNASGKTGLWLSIDDGGMLCAAEGLGGE